MPRYDCSLHGLIYDHINFHVQYTAVCILLSLGQFKKALSLIHAMDLPDLAGMHVKSMMTPVKVLIRDLFKWGFYNMLIRVLCTIQWLAGGYHRYSWSKPSTVTLMSLLITMPTPDPPQCALLRLGLKAGCSTLAIWSLGRR